MKTKVSSFSERYLAALRKYLKRESHANSQSALRLGHQAVSLCVETLELARIHERALAALEISNGNNGLTKRAGIFFTEAHTPIEENHRSARQTKVHVSKLKDASHCNFLVGIGPSPISRITLFDSAERLRLCVNGKLAKGM